MALKTLDVRGATCPGPVVEAKKAIDSMAPGDQLEVIATDPGSVPDFQAMARNAKHLALKGQRNETEADGRTLYIHLLERVG